MSNDSKKIGNPGYLWACRIAFWGTMLFTIPLFLYQIYTYKTGSPLSNTVTLLLHSYLVAGVYVLGYRLDNPPKWSRWLMPNKWILEWRYLVYADPKTIKSNRTRLLAVVGGGAVFTFLFLAFLNDKL